METFEKKKNDRHLSNTQARTIPINWTNHPATKIQTKNKRELNNRETIEMFNKSGNNLLDSDLSPLQNYCVK